MEALYKSVEEYLPTCFKLTTFQLFYITLVCLRLELSIRFSSHQFNASHQIVSKYFYETLFILYSRLESLVYWPDRETLIKTMPSIFKEKFGEKITVIMVLMVNIYTTRNYLIFFSMDMVVEPAINLLPKIVAF